MKTVFSEYYPISKKIINNAWEHGIFSYDTNVLLNIYRYSNSTRNKIFENIEYFKDKTILTHQVCYEYQQNRRSVEDNLLQSYEKISGILTNYINNLESGELAKYRKHCAIDIEKDIIKPIKTTTNRIIKKINDIQKNHTSYLDASHVHERITELFDGKISIKFSEDELKKIYTEGKNRYEKKIPPGFADNNTKKNANENSLYGDLIIWKQLIEISKKRKCDIIFVTDDRKKDWWDIHQGEIKGALPALYREFKDLTSQNILIYTVEDFMKYAPEHSEIDVPKKVMTEIVDLHKSDQIWNQYYNHQLYNNINELFKTYDPIEELKKLSNQVSINNLISTYENQYGDIKSHLQKHNDNIQNIIEINKLNTPYQDYNFDLISKLNLLKENK